MHLDDPGTKSAILHRSPSPLTLLAAGPIDPFRSYPVTATPRVNILVDHFLSSVGPGLTSFLTPGTDRNSMKTIYLPFSAWSTPASSPAS